MVKRYFTKIEWDTDGLDTELPDRVEMPDNILSDDGQIQTDYLSDKYGFLIKSYRVEAESDRNFIDVLKDICDDNVELVRKGDNVLIIGTGEYKDYGDGEPYDTVKIKNLLEGNVDFTSIPEVFIDNLIDFYKRDFTDFHKIPDDFIKTLDDTYTWEWYHVLKDAGYEDAAREVKDISFLLGAMWTRFAEITPEYAKENGYGFLFEKR